MQTYTTSSTNTLTSFGLKFLSEKNFEQKIPRVRVEDAEKIRYEDAKTAMRRGLLYLAALQAKDGHWPAENSGIMFLNSPFVSSCLSPTVYKFSTLHRL